MMFFWKNADTGNVIESEVEPPGEWFEIDEIEYEESCSPLTSRSRQYELKMGPQEPPNDYRIFNRRQADGSYRPLRLFFEAAVMKADGYTDGAPSALAAKIDGEVCAESTCEGCGHVGLIYEPWHKEGSYRAFAVCPRCKRREEF